MPRKQKIYHYIYKTTNVVTCKYYYGMHSTDNLDDGYLGSGRRLVRSINKYGKENHIREILEFVENRKELRKREKEIVNLNEITKEDCMNLMVGGEGGFISDEQQKNRAICANKKLNEKLKSDNEFYKQFCDNIKKAKFLLSCINGKTKKPKKCTFEGRKHKKETKEKIGAKNSLKQIGNKNSQFNTCWITNEKENKKIYKGDNIPNGWRLGRIIKIN